MRRAYVYFGIFIVSFLMVRAWQSHAADLTQAKDTLSNSQPAIDSDHTMQFTANQAVPNNGSIRYDFDSGFSGFSALDVGDYDLVINGIERTVSADGACTGGDYADVTTTGTRIDVDLCGSNASVSAGYVVEFQIGTNATTGGTGDEQLTNPATTGSKNIEMTTHNASGALLDDARAIVVIINPLTLNALSPFTPTPIPTPERGGVVLPTCSRIADFTSDCLVNIRDLSIMMYNWPVVRNDPRTDLNRDGVVGIIDLSILLFWWTG